MITHHEAIDAIADYCAVFTGNVPKAARDRWVQNLLGIRPDYEVLRKAITRCADNDLSAAWSRLSAAIRIESGLHRQAWGSEAGGLWEGFSEFSKKYRAEGYSRESTPENYAHSGEEPITDWKVARICMSLIMDITRGAAGCPAEVATHDIFAEDDEESRWFWAEVRKRYNEKYRR